MKTKQPTHGGKRAGAGAKPTICQDGSPSIVFTMRISPALREAITAAGGSSAARKILEAALVEPRAAKRARRA